MTETSGQPPSLAPARKSAWRDFLLGIGLSAAVLVLLCFERPRAFAIRALFSLPRVAMDWQYVSGLGEVDAVEVSLLRKPTSATHSTNRIFGGEIVLTTVLKATDAQEFAARWRQLQVITDLGEQTLCHFPVFGIRFFRDGKLRLESSFCWFCANVSLPSALGTNEVRFNENHPSATNVFTALTGLFPGEQVKAAGRTYFEDSKGRPQ